jgi:DNA repair exonuclease SbcCD ATPase subunit
VDEEVVLLEEQLAAAQADIERLQTRLAESEALATQRAGEAAELRRELSAQEQALGERTAEAEELRTELAAAQADARQAAQSYRELVLQREPDLPAELVAGDSVAEIDASVSRARQTVAQVRQHIEQQAQALRVPAGAPVRGGPDVSGLTAGEKIRLGLRQT